MWKWTIQYPADRAGTSSIRTAAFGDSFATWRPQTWPGGLLKASWKPPLIQDYSRLFKIIQERGMEWCGVAESRSASFPLHVGPSNNRTHTYPDQILGYGVDQFHCCLSCLKLILSHPESGLTQLNHAQMENMPGLPDSFGHCTDLVGGLAFSMHSARFRFRSCDSSGSYF